MAHHFDRSRIAFCLAIGLLALAGGCGHGGIVRQVIYSDDGRVVLYHGESGGDSTRVADRQGRGRVGGDGVAFLSPDGRYVVLVERDGSGRSWPGSRIVLYDVAKRAARTGEPIDEALYNPKSLATSAGWEAALAEVYLDAGPSVILAVRMVKLNETPPRADDTRYIRWTPGKAPQAVAQPAGALCLSKPQSTDAADSWVLVRQPGKGVPFRTVWVHPDGDVIELLRSNQGFGATSFCVIAFPFVFWSPSYWRMTDWLTESKRADPVAREKEEPRLQSLIAARKAAARPPR